MGYFLTTASYNTTGTKSITVPGQPLSMSITVSQKFNTIQNFAHKSVGVSDGTNQVCDTFFQDTTGGKTERSSSKIVSHWERVSGTLTEKVAAHIDSSTAPWTSTQVKFIIDTADVNYQLLVEVLY